MAAVERYVVARAAQKGRGGFVLALFVRASDDGKVVIRRLVGQSFRIKKPRVAKEMVVPQADVIRDATPRELALGFPV